MSSAPAPFVDLAATVLERRAGLRFDATGRDRLARALTAAADQAGVAANEYAQRLDGDPRALAELQDRATLQESSWFRDPGVWEQIATRLLPSASTAGHTVLWSAGCANGQEAYSLAIACEEAGLRGCRVLASDVSRVAAARTSAGVYTERELRGLSDERRARWLRPVGDGWEVVPELRRAVTVVDENLATGSATVADGSCGLVLCRYVLIYLAPAAVEQVLRRVERALAPGGHLLIGAAESLWHLSDRFVLEPLDDAFAYRPRRAGDGPSEMARGTRRAVDPSATVPRPGAVPERCAAPTPTPSQAARRPATSSAAPADANALLHEGERALAAGDVATAIIRFRGAAYLVPDNPIAHLQLGLALERAEDPGAARAFRAAWSALRSADEDALRDALGGYRAQELVHLVAAKLGEAV